MKIRSLVAAVAAATSLSLTAAAVPAAATESRAADARAGQRSLVQVLSADGNRFDRNPTDFDVLERAVRAVLAAKPDSPVGLLADGSVRLTAFLPTDRAFRRLVEDLTGRHVAREADVFAAVARTYDADTIEAVLLYHVVPGAPISRSTARSSDGARLTTALEGAGVRVDVRRQGQVFLLDRDPDDLNARISKFGINQGNRQIAHRIDRVLRPLDL